jgi:diaminopimelate decarboxylase
MHEILPETASKSATDHLEIGGCDVVELAATFGTPMVIYDRTALESKARAFTSAIGDGMALYAAKAFCCVAICELVDRMGMGIDVCTGGELSTALAANFPPERIVFHGNNKSASEIAAARDAGVGRIVLDSFEEIERVSEAGYAGKTLVRVTPGVEAHTHEYVQTGQEDSKFGFTLANGVAAEAIRRALKIQSAPLVGLHAHIGSQIFEFAAFDLAIERLADLVADVSGSTGWSPEELNVGGGLGIAHTHDEITPDPADALARISQAVQREFTDRNLPMPRLLVEPGRSLVGPCAVTVYEVGTVKEIPGVRTYVSVDGGMSDNIRPALYGARYEAFLANRMTSTMGPRVTVAGKHCESGDVLIRDVHLPADVRPGDLLCIPATGGYTYSMASNYNRVPRPAVLMVQDGRPTLIVERETNEDLLRLDRRLDGSEI